MRIEIDMAFDGIHTLGETPDEIRSSIEKLVRDKCMCMTSSDNHVNEFLESVDVERGMRTVAAKLFEAYLQFCKERRHEPVGRNKFYKLVCNVDGVYKRYGTGNVLTLHNISYPKPIEHDDDEWL